MGSVISLKPGFHWVQIQYLDLNAESRFKCKFNAFICWQFRRDRTGHWDFIEFATADSEIALHTQYLQWKMNRCSLSCHEFKIFPYTHTGLVTQQMLLCRYSSVFENMTSGFDESGLKLVFQGCSNSTTIIFNLIMLDDHNHLFKSISGFYHFFQYLYLFSLAFESAEKTGVVKTSMGWAVGTIQ